MRNLGAVSLIPNFDPRRRLDDRLAEPQDVSSPSGAVVRPNDRLSEPRNQPPAPAGVAQVGFNRAMDRDVITDSVVRYLQPLTELATATAAPPIQPQTGLDSAMRAASSNTLLSPPPPVEAMPVAQRLTEREQTPQAQGIQPLTEREQAAPSQGIQPLSEPEIHARLGAAAHDYLPGEAQRRARVLLNTTPTPHKGQHVGLGERLLHGVKSFGKTLWLTRNPVDAVIAGGMGVADPDSYHRMQRNAIDLPRALDEAGVEMKLQERNRDAAKDYGMLTGRSPFSDDLTPDAEHKRAQQRDWLSEANDRTAHRLNEVNDRATRALTDSAKLNLERFDSFVKASPNGAKVPPELAKAAGIPAMAGQPIYKNEQTGEHYVKGTDGTMYQFKGGIGTVVKDEHNSPIKGYTPPPPREPEKPWSYHRARGFEAALKARGWSDANQMVPNPAHEDHFQVLKAANEQSVNENGPGARLSDEALHARAEKKYPRNVRAGTLISNEEADSHAAGAYDSDRASGRRPVTTPTKRADGARKVGDPVMLKGKRYKIAEIHPNGDYDLELDQ
jgi:hypothetical protein